MENTEIIYICNSKNNKNVRANELKILEKYPDELYFIFGENNENTKKRYYDDLKILEEDFKALLKIKKELEKKSAEKKEIKTSKFSKSSILKLEEKNEEED